MDPYIELIQAAADAEGRLVGNAFTETKLRAAGIDIDDEGKVSGYEGAGEEAFVRFVSEFEKFGGEFSREVIEKAVRPVFDKYPNLNSIF